MPKEDREIIKFGPSANQLTKKEVQKQIDNTLNNSSNSSSPTSSSTITPSYNNPYSNQPSSSDLSNFKSSELVVQDSNPDKVEQVIENTTNDKGIESPENVIINYDVLSLQNFNNETVNLSYLKRGFLYSQPKSDVENIDVKITDNNIFVINGFITQNGTYTWVFKCYTQTFKDILVTININVSEFSLKKNAGVIALQIKKTATAGNFVFSFPSYKCNYPPSFFSEQRSGTIDLDFFIGNEGYLYFTCDTSTLSVGFNRFWITIYDTTAGTFLELQITVLDISDTEDNEVIIQDQETLPSDVEKPKDGTYQGPNKGSGSSTGITGGNGGDSKVDSNSPGSGGSSSNPFVFYNQPTYYNNNAGGHLVTWNITSLSWSKKFNGFNYFLKLELNLQWVYINPSEETSPTNTSWHNNGKWGLMLDDAVASYPYLNPSIYNYNTTTGKLNNSIGQIYYTVNNSLDNNFKLHTNTSPHTLTSSIKIYFPMGPTDFDINNLDRINMILVTDYEGTGNPAQGNQILSNIAYVVAKFFMKPQGSNTATSLP